MSIEETARSIIYLRMVGLSDTQICDFLVFFATGIGIPCKDTATE